MAKQLKTGLLFGGATVSAFMGYGSVNGSVVISKRATCDYGGLVGSEFVEPADLPGVVESVLAEVVGNQVTGQLVIGIPSQFCKVIVRDVALEFSKPVKISSREVAKLFNEIEIEQIEGFNIISKNAVYFKIDGGKAVIDATGEMATKLSAQVSVVLVDDSFIQTVADVVGERWLPRLLFVPVVLAQANYFINDDVRDDTCVLISCGMFETSVAVCSGDSLVYLRTMELGLGHIVNDVASVLGVGFLTAKLLVDEAVLSVTMGQNDNYQISLGDGSIQKYAAAKVNDIIKNRLSVMAQHLRSSIKKSLGDGIFEKEFYVCGGHLDALAGVRDLLSRAFKVRIRQGVCPFTGLARAEYTERAILRYIIK